MTATRIQWPPLPSGPPPPPPPRPPPIRHPRSDGRADRAASWRPRSVFAAPTLATPATTIPPGSPWAAGSRAAWVLDERVLWRRRDSIVHEVRQWITCGKKLSAQAQSNLGLDPFLYQVKGLLIQPPERLELLKQRLDELSVSQPDEFHRAVHYEQLGDLLGKEFSWVQLPKTKTNGDSPVRKPW